MLIRAFLATIKAHRPATPFVRCGAAWVGESCLTRGTGRRLFSSGVALARSTWREQRRYSCTANTQCLRAVLMVSENKYIFVRSKCCYPRACDGRSVSGRIPDHLV